MEADQVEYASLRLVETEENQVKDWKQELTDVPFSSLCKATIYISFLKKTSVAKVYISFSLEFTRLFLNVLYTDQTTEVFFSLRANNDTAK